MIPITSVLTFVFQLVLIACTGPSLYSSLPYHSKPGVRDKKKMNLIWQMKKDEFNIAYYQRICLLL